MVKTRMFLVIGCCLVSMVVHSQTTPITNPRDISTFQVLSQIEPGPVTLFPKFVSEMSPITLHPKSESKITGTGKFKISGTFRRVSGGVAGEVGDNGGGCLIYQAIKSKTSTCTNDDDCNKKITDRNGHSLPTPPSQGYGYCAMGDSSTTNDSKTCWYKPLPDDSSCMKSPTRPLILNVWYQTPLVDTRAIGDARWRVVTCHSIRGFGCTGNTAADKVYQFGDIWPPRD